MSGELETAALASGGGWLRWKRQHADIPPGTPCANCETPLQGTYCHVCGQLAEDFHRSSWKLLVEAVESLLHLDGRLVRTMPNLIKARGEETHNTVNLTGPGDRADDDEARAEARAEIVADPDMPAAAKEAALAAIDQDWVKFSRSV